MSSFSVIAALLLAQAGPVVALTPVADEAASAASLSSENRAIVRCSAAFSLVAFGQANGNADAQKWPAMGERGREFFVRALAGLMDETGLNRDGVSQLVSTEAQRLWDTDTLNDVMPACLLMLETSGV